MKSRNIRLFTVFTIFILALLSNVSIFGQTRQSRGFQQASNQGGLPTSDENRKAQAEIEMMREMITQRRAQQEQQRVLLQELQQAINVASPEAIPNQQQYHNWEQEDPISQRQRVTSGSTLSIIESQEREDLSILEQKFNMEIQVAQREIEMLKKQLEIANRQLSQCQAGTVTHNTAANSFNNTNVSSRRVSRTEQPISQKTKVAKKQNERQQVKAQPRQENEANKAARAEIEMMQKMLQERRAQQEQQMKLIRDLQQAVSGAE